MECVSKKKIVFIYQNDPVDRWALSASSAAVNHPVTELTNESPTLTWLSTAGAGPQWVEGISPGATSDQIIDSIAIVNHNCSDLATVQIQMWEIGGASVYNQTFSMVNYSVAAGSKTINKIRPYKTRVLYPVTSGPIPHRWRLTFFDPSGTGTTFFEIGRLIIGTKFQPSNDFVDGSGDIYPIDGSRISESYGGNQFSDNRPKKRGCTIQPSVSLNPLDVPEWFNLIHAVGKRGVIVVDPWPKFDNSSWLLASDAPAAFFNLASQIYGRQIGNVTIAKINDQTSKMNGKIDIVEAL